MKKALVFASVLVGITATAQEWRVGINTTTPRATLEVSAKGTGAQGILYPSVTEATKNT